MSQDTFSVNGHTSAIRKIRKPLMEKKRRARINDSLEELKDILLKNTVAIAYGQRPTKLEKADILEMTVRYLNTLHKRLATQRTFNNNRECGVSSTTAPIEATNTSFSAGNSFTLGKNSGNFQRGIGAVKREPDEDKENAVPHTGAARIKSFTSSSKSAFTPIRANVEQKVRKHSTTDADDPWRPWWHLCHWMCWIKSHLACEICDETIPLLNSSLEKLIYS